MSEELVEIESWRGSDHEDKHRWMFPADVAAVINLMDYVIHTRFEELDEHGKGCYCDVWPRNEIEVGDFRNRAFDGGWTDTPEEAIDRVVEWVRNGCPSGWHSTLWDEDGVGRPDED